MTEYALLLVGTVLVKFLGPGPFMGVSKGVDHNSGHRCHAGGGRPARQAGETPAPQRLGRDCDQGLSKQLETATGMGLAATFAMTLFAN